MCIVIWGLPVLCFMWLVDVTEFQLQRSARVSGRGRGIPPTACWRHIGRPHSLCYSLHYFCNIISPVNVRKSSNIEEHVLLFWQNWYLKLMIPVNRTLKIRFIISLWNHIKISSQFILPAKTNICEFYNRCKWHLRARK